MQPPGPPPAAPGKRRCLEPSPRDPDTRATKMDFIKPRVWSDYQSFRYAAAARPYCRGTHGPESRNSGYMIPPKRVVVLVPLPAVAGVASPPFCLTLLLPPFIPPSRLLPRSPCFGFSTLPFLPQRLRLPHTLCRHKHIISRPGAFPSKDQLIRARPRTPFPLTPQPFPLRPRG